MQIRNKYPAQSNNNKNNNNNNNNNKTIKDTGWSLTTKSPMEAWKEDKTDDIN